MDPHAPSPGPQQEAAIGQPDSTTNRHNRQKGIAMNTSEVLNKAADLIEERGWTQGTYDTLAEGVCLESALSLAEGLGAGRDAWQVANTCPAGLALRDYLRLGDWNYSITCSLWNWNDSQHAAEIVIATLRAAAVIEAAKESAVDRDQVSA